MVDNWLLFMLPMEWIGGCVAATFIQILKIVVHIGDVTLDKGVPTPSLSADTLGT